MNLQCARAQRRRIERADQRGAGALRHRVHAERAVARVDEALQQLEADAVLRPEPVERRPDRFGVRGDEMRRRATVRLGPDVVREARRAVVEHAGGALHRGAGGRDEARGQRGRTPRARIALEQHAVDAGVAQGQRRGQPAGAGADDRDRHLGAAVGHPLRAPDRWCHQAISSLRPRCSSSRRLGGVIRQSPCRVFGVPRPDGPAESSGNLRAARSAVRSRVVPAHHAVGRCRYCPRGLPITCPSS